MSLHSSACPISAAHQARHGHPGRQPHLPDPHLPDRHLRDLVRLLARQAAAEWLAGDADATADAFSAQH